MKKHILLVHEDKHELKSFMAIVNQCAGAFKCTYASSPAHALEMLRYLEADFIFIDHKPGGFDSIKLVSAIRCGLKHALAGIYLYGGEIDDEANKMATLAGASGCVSKSQDMQMTLSLFNSIFSIQCKLLLQRQAL